MVDQAAAFERQADACRQLGSPMYGALLHRVAAELGTGGPLDRVLAGHAHGARPAERDRGGGGGATPADQRGRTGGRAERAVVREHIARLARQAGADAPFVHLWLEPERRSPDAEPEFLVRAEQWPSAAPSGSGDAAGRGTVLGTAGAHGPTVTWER